MAALAASSLNGVKIYNLASGKTLPQWLAQKTKRSLSKDEDYRRRIELLQDFHFPTASQRIKMSSDGHFVVATGVYPPSVKVFDVRDLSLKFERRLDAEVVQFEILSEDFGKLCFLQTDRSLAFHAPYGTHYNLRIPRFGRDMVYHRENCNLYVAASANEVYRVNLDQGRFLAPLEISAPAANVVKLNPVHQLLGIGCEEGIVECWDTRSQTRAGILQVPSPNSARLDDPTYTPMQITSLEFDDDGLTFAVGTSEGNCLLYDLRSSKPLLTKSHQYGLPILDIKFHDYSRKIMSTDKKVIKIWDKNNGEIFTNVETPADIADVCVVEAAQGKSGVMLVAGEQERVMAYYVPELGIAPKWCSFLDSLTEELEEEAQTSVYEDYKFVTRQEIKTFGLEHMIGTPLLKAYMHGFFMDARLYEKVKAIAEPFAYDLWRKEQIQKKLEAKQANRITIQRRLPKVNRAAAEKLLLASKKKKSTTLEEASGDADTTGDAAGSVVAFENPLGDDRFARMFTSKDFEIDENSETYQLLHPNKQHAAKHKKDDVDSDADERDDEEDDQDVVAGRFDLVSSDEESELEGKGSDDSSSEEEEENDDDERDHKQQKPRKQQQPVHKKRFYELAKGEKMGDLIDFGLAEDRTAQKEKRKVTKLPLSARVQMEQIKEQEKSRFYKSSEAEPNGSIAKSVDGSGGGYMREMSFVPKSDRVQQELDAADGEQAQQPAKRAKRGIGQLRLSQPSSRGRGRGRRFSKKQR